MKTRYGLIDCNNFFVSCERVFRPDLTTKPTAVLSNNDGCIIARSNEVKALDVPMGVPLFKVKTLLSAHDATLFSANFELYGDMSQRIVTILREEVPLVEVYSIDECFIDMSQLPIDDVDAWAHRLRERIWKEVGIPTSIGIAPTKTLAKVASTYAKTHGDGIAVIETDETRLTLLDGLGIEEVWGIGRRLGPKLRDKGVSTARQLIEASDAWLEQQFNITGMNMVTELRGTPKLAFGDKHAERKMIMRSRSFGHKVRAIHQLESAVATFTAQAAHRLRGQGSVCRAIVVFLATGPRAAQVRRVSHLVTLPEATGDTGTLIGAALSGLESLYDEDFSYQKAGIILVDIMTDDAWQLSLLAGDPNVREQKLALMTAVDTLNKRFGGGTVWHASEARLQADWHSKKQLRSPRYTTQFAELPILHR